MHQFLNTILLSTTSYKHSTLFLIIATSTLLFTPHGAHAIFFLLLMPVGLGAIVATFVLEVVFWCAVVFCNGGDPGAVQLDICDINHPRHADAIPTIVMNASFVSTSTSWGNSVSVPGPADQMILTWESTNAIYCSSSSSTAGVILPEEPADRAGTSTLIPGSIAGPGEKVELTIRCLNPTCNYSRSDTQSYTIPLPNSTTTSFFSVAPKIVRYGGASQFDWNIIAGGRAPYLMNCQITGALTTPYSFNTTNMANGTRATQVVTNNSLSELSCTEPLSGKVFGSSNQLEVIPRTYEL